MKPIKRKQIAIIGSAGPEEYPERGKPQPEIFSIAFELGKLIAENGDVVFTGGKGGIMEAAAKGAKNKNGLTVGVVKGNKRNSANRYTDVEIVTNVLTGSDVGPLLMSCDGVIGVGGGAGTLQELTFAYRNNIPTVVINSVEGVCKQYANKFIDTRKSVKLRGVKSAKQAVSLLYKLIK